MSILQEQSLSLKRLRQLLNTLSLAVFFIQILLQFDYDNIVCNILSLSIFYITVNTVFRVENMRFSSAFLGIIVFLTIAANSIAPVLGTLFDGHPLSYSLIVPIETFVHRFVYGIVLLVAFYFSKQQGEMSLTSSVSNLSYSLKLNTAFSEKAIWAFGLIGLISFFVKYLPLGEGIIKLLDGFGFLMWTPFILAVYSVDNDSENKKAKTNTKTLLFLYFIVMIFISLLTNSRMAMIGPIGVVFATWLLLVLVGNRLVNVVLLRKGILIGLVTMFVLSVFLDISTAILMARSVRGNVSTDELIATTYKNFQNKEVLDKFRMSSVREDDDVSPLVIWQENYLRNPFLGRFVQIKFDDNLFHRISEYSDDTKEKLKQTTFDKILVVFPSPVLDLFNINLEKEFLNSFSTGDIMEVLSGRSALGGFKTGSIPANAYAIYGWYYPFFLFIIYYLIFSLHAGIVSLPKRFNKPSHISTLGLILPFSLYTAASLDGVPQLVSLLIRGAPQTMFIFYLSIYFLKRLGYIKNI